jgi:hypothetical protein
MLLTQLLEPEFVVQRQSFSYDFLQELAPAREIDGKRQEQEAARRIDHAAKVIHPLTQASGPPCPDASGQHREDVIGTLPNSTHTVATSCPENVTQLPVLRGSTQIIV